MPPDATADASTLVRALADEVLQRAELRTGEVANFAAWVRVRLDVLAEQIDEHARQRPSLTVFHAPQQRHATHIN